MTGPQERTSAREQRRSVALLRQAAAALVLLEAAVVLAAWWSGRPTLTSVVPGWTTMKANTAALLGCAGGALVCLSRQEGGARALGRTLGGLIVLVASLVLLQDLFGWDLGLDQVLVRDTTGDAAAPGRMAPNTAIAFMLLGGSFASSAPTSSSCRLRARELLVLGCFGVAFLALLGRLYGTPPLYGIERHTAMALPTAAGLLVASMGSLCLEPVGSVVTVLTRDDLAGYLSRRLGPAAFTFPTVVGLARLVGERWGFYGAEFGLAAHVAMNVIGLAAIAWWSVARLGALDADRRLAMEALEAERRRLRTVLHVLPVGVWIVDATGAIVDINAAAREIWGKETPRVNTIDGYSRYRAWFTATGKLMEPREWGAARALAERRRVEQEVDIEAFDGTRRTILNYASPIVGEDEALAGAVAVNVDVTDRKRVERELEALRSQLEARVQQRTAELAATNAELEAFTYSVSHDLRAPLRWIDGFSRALEEDQAERLDASSRDLLRQIRESAHRMSELIEALLRLSRVARAPLELEQVDLTSIAREVLHELATSDPSRRSETVVQDEIAARGDRQLLRVVLDNLLRNAWKFTKDREVARIEVGVARVERDVPTYFVRDNGVGFDMTYAGRLFAPFSRLHPTSEFEGTGIGLALVRRIVQRHGGRVWAQGTPGVGATFFFTLGPTSRTKSEV